MRTPYDADWPEPPGEDALEVLAWFLPRVSAPGDEASERFHNAGWSTERFRDAYEELADFGALRWRSKGSLMRVTALGRAWVAQEVLPLPLMPDGFDPA